MHYTLSLSMVGDFPSDWRSNSCLSTLVRGDLASKLRGPAAIIFISRNTCSDSITKLFCACFCGGIAQVSRDMLQNGVSHRCPCVKLSTKGGYRIILGKC